MFIQDTPYITILASSCKNIIQIQKITGTNLNIFSNKSRGSKAVRAKFRVLGGGEGIKFVQCF